MVTIYHYPNFPVMINIFLWENFAHTIFWIHSSSNCCQYSKIAVVTPLFKSLYIASKQARGENLKSKAQILMQEECGMTKQNYHRLFKNYELQHGHMSMKTLFHWVISVLSDVIRIAKSLKSKAVIRSILVFSFSFFPFS